MRVSRASASSARLRADDFAGRKPSKAKRPVGRPAIDSAAIAAHGPGTATTVTPAVAAAVEAVPVEAAAEQSSDEAYIETPRCASCNECIQINDKMFQYDGNKQAFIANINAGTYAQLVEAAENCQVAIIHPGKPRDPNEPGLEELLVRAEPFR